MNSSGLSVALRMMHGQPKRHPPRSRQTANSKTGFVLITSTLATQIRAKLKGNG